MPRYAAWLNIVTFSLKSSFSFFFSRPCMGTFFIKRSLPFHWDTNMPDHSDFMLIMNVSSNVQGLYGCVVYPRPCVWTWNSLFCTLNCGNILPGLWYKLHVLNKLDTELGCSAVVSGITSGDGLPGWNAQVPKRWKYVEGWWWLKDFKELNPDAHKLRCSLAG